MARSTRNDTWNGPPSPEENDFGERHFERHRHHVRSADSLGELMAEEAVLTLTSGEYQDIEHSAELLDEELGGPFVETSAEEELGFEESTFPADATVEPFPRTQGGLGDEELEELDDGRA